MSSFTDKELISEEVRIMFTTKTNLRVSDQNDVSWLCIIVEIYHSDQKPSK